jgi:hypothetical protein
MVIEELLVREGELTQREETLTTREEKEMISEKALTQVSPALDEEWTKGEAARQEYLGKIEAHTARGKLVLDIDKMLGEKRVELDELEFIELQRLLWDIEADRAVEANRLATLVRVLENLDMPSNPGMPRDLRMAVDVLGAVDMILECMKGAYVSSHSPWD